MRKNLSRLSTVAGLLAAIVAATPAFATTVSILPAAVSVPVGGTRHFTAYVDGAVSSAVVWSVNGVTGGNSTAGLIDAAGNYTAPAAPPEGWRVELRARSKVDGNASATAVVVVRNQIPWISSVSPSRPSIGPLTINVYGSRFVAGAKIRWNGVPLETSFVSSTRLMARTEAREAGNVTITVANPGPDAVSTGTVIVVVAPTATRTPTSTRRPESTQTATREPTRAATRTFTREATRTATRTATREPTRAATATFTREPTREATATSTREPTRVATATSTREPTLAATSTREPTLAATSTREPTRVPTATSTREPTPMATSTSMPEATRTMMPEATRTMMPEATRTMTMTREPTRVPTATSTPGSMMTMTMTMMPTAAEPTRTGTRNTPAATRTPTRVATSGISVGVAPASSSLQTGATLQLTATVNGSTDQSVTWAVNNVAGGDSSVGTISATGLYAAPASLPANGFVTVTATANANGTSKGSAIVSIQDPLAITYGRFLDQATFGPTQQLTAHLAQVGIPAFIDEQLATPESAWPALDTADRSDAVVAFFNNARSGQDQLRQRVIYAFAEIIVESMNKNTNGDEIVPWLQLLSRNAFGNYRTMLREITLDASMGKFLDLANSGYSGAPNENYPREVMQLFSIGLYQLNLDGSVQVDAQGASIPTYTQTDVQQLAKALTGWTYGNAAGATPTYFNSNYYPGPMLPLAKYHNSTAKVILGHTLPANQTIQKDLDDSIDILFQHPNVGPFLSIRLIHALVTSNPTPAYVARVAAVFNSDGSGQRGNLGAMVRAILLDPEARNDSPPNTFGRLRTPMQHLIRLARALNLDLGDPGQFAYLFYNMNEGLLDAASVFGHYSPFYRIPKGNGLYGPEFQIYSVSDAINRAQLSYYFLRNPWPINPVLQPFVAVAGNHALLVNAVDNALLYGRMSQSTRDAILASMPAMYDDNMRVLNALYLAITAGEYQVQR